MNFSFFILMVVCFWINEVEAGGSGVFFKKVKPLEHPEDSRKAAVCAGHCVKKGRGACESYSIVQGSCVTSADRSFGQYQAHPPPPILVDCEELKQNNATAATAVHNFQFKDCVGSECGYQAYCDMATLGGGWTVIQRRYDGSVDFHNQNYAAYAAGFGQTSAEHWLGNDIVYELTQGKSYELLVQLKDPFQNGCYLNAHYTTFKLTDPIFYTLEIGVFMGGSAGDAMGYLMNKGAKFSTLDKDQDQHASLNCAADFNHGGPFWWASCGHAGLNAPWNPNGGCIPSNSMGIRWRTGFGLGLTQCSTGKLVCQPPH